MVYHTFLNQSYNSATASAPLGGVGGLAGRRNVALRSRAAVVSHTKYGRPVRFEVNCIDVRVVMVLLSAP